MSHLVDTFRKIDHDHSGQWSEKELLEAVRLPDFEKRIEEAGLKPMTPTEVGLVFQVLDEQNHKAIDLDTFIEFFKQARTLGITLAFDDAGVKRDDEAGRLRKSLKTQKHAELYEVDAAKQEKEVQLSKLMGRIHNNDRELPSKYQRFQCFVPPWLKSRAIIFSRLLVRLGAERCSYTVPHISSTAQHLRQKFEPPVQRHYRCWRQVFGRLSRGGLLCLSQRHVRFDDFHSSFRDQN